MHREHALGVINDESRQYLSVTNFISMSFDSARIFTSRVFWNFYISLKIIIQSTNEWIEILSKIGFTSNFHLDYSQADVCRFYLNPFIFRISKVIRT